MASKKELLAAQAFSRRRLLTAFVSGAPGGRELEPAKPLRGVVAGVALSVLVVIGSLIAGNFTGSLPDGWEERSIVIVEGDGARYVALSGTLHPVYNMASARLLVGPEGDVVMATARQIDDLPRGAATLGIEGAPDALPPSSHLITTGWLACTDGDETRTDLSVDRAPAGAGAGLLVRSEDDTYLVAGSHRYLVRPVNLPAMQLVLDNSQEPIEVPDTWLNLFTEGAGLEALAMPHAGDSPPGRAGDVEDLLIGQVVTLQNAAGQEQRTYVLDDDGHLVELTPMALEMYSLGVPDLEDSDADLAEPMMLTYSQAQDLTNAEAGFVPESWPVDVPSVVGADEAPCAQLDTVDGEPVVTFVGSGGEAFELPASVDAGHGALVALAGSGSAREWALIDETGQLYPIATITDVNQLGYLDTQAVVVPRFWAALFPPGPTLSNAAAMRGVADS